MLRAPISFSIGEFMKTSCLKYNVLRHCVSNITSLLLHCSSLLQPHCWKNKHTISTLKIHPKPTFLVIFSLFLAEIHQQHQPDTFFFSNFQRRVRIQRQLDSEDAQRGLKPVFGSKWPGSWRNGQKQAHFCQLNHHFFQRQRPEHTPTL